MVSYSILSGLTGFVFIEILCRPLEIFGWYPMLFRKVLFGSTANRKFENMKWWQLAIYKPLAGCGVCNSGWVAIAVFFVHFDTSFFHPLFFTDPKFYTFIFFLVGAIFTAWALEKVKKIVKKTIEKKTY